MVSLATQAHHVKGHNEDHSQVELLQAQQSVDTADSSDSVVVGEIMPYVQGARLLSVAINGELVGLRIYSIDQGSLFEKFNIPANTLITAIDNIPLNSFDNILQALGKVSPKSQIQTLEILEPNKEPEAQGDKDSTEIIIQDYEESARKRDQRAEAREIETADPEVEEVKGRLNCVSPSLLPNFPRNVPACIWMGPSLFQSKVILQMFN